LRRQGLSEPTATAVIGSARAFRHGSSPSSIVAPVSMLPHYGKNGMRDTLAVLIAGFDWTAACRFCALRGERFVSRGTFDACQREIGPVLEELVAGSIARARSESADRGVWAGDGAYDHPRHGKSLIYTVTATETGKIVWYTIVAAPGYGGEFGKCANQMELSAVGELAAFLRACEPGRRPSIYVRDDSQAVNKILESVNDGVEAHLRMRQVCDCGHKIKNMVKAAKSMGSSGKTRNPHNRNRVQVLFNSDMIAIFVYEFKRALAMPHDQRREFLLDMKQRILTEPFDLEDEDHERRRRIVWWGRDTENGRAMLNKLVDLMITSSLACEAGITTQVPESFNHSRLTFMTKQLKHTLSSPIRLRLTILSWNEPESFRQQLMTTFGVELKDGWPQRTLFRMIRKSCRARVRHFGISRWRCAGHGARRLPVFARRGG
jgi:hypothetical protein